MTIGFIHFLSAIIYFKPSFALDWNGWFGVLSNILLLFGIPFLYYYINNRSSIIFCLFSRDIYLSLGISSSCSFLTASELFCDEDFEALVILSKILLPAKSPVFSATFWVALFVLLCYKLLSMIKTFQAVFTNYVFTYILPIFSPIFLSNDKNP